MPVTKSEALKFFNEGEERVVEIDGGSKWFIPSFIDFQYGQLSEQNRAHTSILLTLKKHKLEKYVMGLASPLEGDKDKEQYKDKEKDKDKEESSAIEKEARTLMVKAH